ncbi:MAG TPA: malate synthase A [Acidimicrobiia bacterium]|mgnify:CR=1 FL=1|nr:malate synthase A [Acidimicrobiia bacterium]
MSYELLDPGPVPELLTDEALQFVEDLHDAFDERRRFLLSLRRERQAEFDVGLLPRFQPDTKHIRQELWRVADAPADLRDRRVEITGPVDRKMMINALNSGAAVFMADFEDATSPTWANLMEGQRNLVDAYRRTLSLDTPDKQYRLNEEVATLMVRPRGLHLPEKHLLVDGRPASASLVDFGLYMFWAGREAIEAGTGPYFYLPKLESHLEARLWNDLFVYAQELLDIPVGTIRATVLIETITAAFEMDEILYELAPHSAGLNAGRWDYIFSIIKKFRRRRDKVLPDRAQVTMETPFMMAYTDLLVATCHRRGAHAIGGMAAFIPNRRDPEVTETALAKVAADKRREAGQGFDGTWVAHPDLVPVARAEFDAVLGDSPNQIHRLRDDVEPDAAALLDTYVPGGRITVDGIRTNVSVGIRYLSSWLTGTGAAAIDDLMEDAATAEISRSQLWQWVQHSARTDDGRLVDADLVKRVADEVMAEIAQRVGDEGLREGRYEEARRLFEDVALSEEFVEFLTIPAYELID